MVGIDWFMALNKYDLFQISYLNDNVRKCTSQIKWSNQIVFILLYEDFPFLILILIISWDGFSWDLLIIKLVSLLNNTISFIFLFTDIEESLCEHMTDLEY